MQKKIEIVIRYLIGATFFVPLILLPGSFIFPFIVPKILAFRTLAVLISGSWILLLLANWGKYKPRFTPVTVLVLAFFASFAISTFLGVDWYKSFWDNHERMLGLFTITHYVLFYLASTSVLKEERTWKNLMKVFLFAGGIVMFLALIQQFDRYLLLNQGGDRSASTLGNPIYVGGYGLFLFFVALMFFLEEQARGWKIYSAVGGVFGLVGLFSSGTRGTLVGFICGLFFLCVYYLLKYRQYRKVRIALIGFLVMSVVTGSLLYTYRKTEFVRSIPAVNRLVGTSFSDSLRTPRFMAWGLAVKGWQEKPIFGWGPNNFYFAFNKYYRPEFLEFGYGETWFDNAHNVVVNALSTQGVVGVATYLSLFAVTMYLLSLAGSRGKISKHMAGVGSAFLLAHLVHNLFVFEDPTSYLYFFFFLAYLNFKLMPGEPAGSRENETNRQLSTQAVAAVSFFALIIIYSTDINPARANMAVLQSLKQIYSKTDALPQYDMAVAIPTPHIDDVRGDFARTVVNLFSQYYDSGAKEAIQKLADRAIEEAEKNLILHPLDIRTHIVLSQLKQMRSVYFGTAQDVADSERLILDALQKSPKRQQLLFMLSGVELALGKNEQCVQYAKQAFDEDPKISESWWRLAIAYSETGQIDKAQSFLREAKNKQIEFDSQGESIVNTIMAQSLVSSSPANKTTGKAK